MISDSAALVMFAMRSSIKFGQQMRQTYVDAAKRRELVLPLPNFFTKLDISSATNYFAGPGRGHVTPGSQLESLLRKRQTPGQTLTPEEEAQVLNYHVEFFNFDLVRAGKIGNAADGTTLDAREFNALITIRQWRRGADPNPSTLQRLAGTFMEIGIDYFTNVPGALNKDTSQGKALAGFLQGMSEIRFSEEKLGEIPGRLLVAAMETVSEHKELLSADMKVQELVTVITKSLSTDIAGRLDQIGDSDLVKKEYLGDWAELVLRSMLSSAGGLVLKDPGRFLGIQQEGQATLVSHVGESVLGMVLDNADLHLDRLFSREGVENVIRSALTVAGENPEILTQSNNTALRKLLSSIAVELSRFDTRSTLDLLPELTRLILDKTGDNLALLWPDLAQNPQQHLLLTAATTTLEILTRQPANNPKWKPQFSSAEVLAVADTVLDEVAENPTWLLNKAAELNDNLKIALEGALEVVRNHADQRLSPGSTAKILKIVVQRIGRRKEFLDNLPGDADLPGQPLITGALDAVFRTIFSDNLDPRAAWQIVRNETIVAVVDVSLVQLAKSRLTARKVSDFADFIKQRIDLLAAGEPWELPTFERELQQALAAP